jgi:hypothetical protein
MPRPAGSALCCTATLYLFLWVFVMRKAVFCVLLIGGYTNAWAEELTVETPFPTVAEMVKGAGAAPGRRALAQLARETYKSAAENCTPSLPEEEQDTLVAATVLSLRLMPKWGINSYWEQQPIGQYLYTMYFRNLLEVHEKVKVIRCGEGDDERDHDNRWFRVHVI